MKIFDSHFPFVKVKATGFGRIYFNFPKETIRWYLGISNLNWYGALLKHSL